MYGECRCTYVDNLYVLILSGGEKIVEMEEDRNFHQSSVILRKNIMFSLPHIINSRKQNLSHVVE